MDDTGLTELFRRAADELDVDDRPPIDANLAGRRRVRIRRGASCGKVGIASATRGPVALDGTWSATEPDRGIAFAVAPESGRYAWSESDPLTATLLAPGTALPAGSDLVVSQTISTPYGTRVIVVHDYPDDGREPR